ncbi:SMP-30/gluconolactonase/LRE family protein [Caballeronia sp. dw_19]|uniref:SMP-30/gluconolactonase/LRE family protein n=1 Tax=Caballeronia sp. dw_19 TaxID=2719791 RepID=UPI00210546CC|nr:SMP-30/gluconolactonase/LRE family protein [Caballeronia sp. dw_19]
MPDEHNVLEMEFVCDGLDFPEGPVALPDGSVVLVEIGRRCLTRVYPDGRKVIVAEPGGGPNGAAVGPDGMFYVCNSGGSKMLREADGTRIVGTANDYSGGRIERIDIRSGKVEVIYTECNGVPLKGPNDIVFDREGGFYFTDLGKSRARERDRGCLYYARTDGSLIREVAFPMWTPNGVGLSPDGAVIFVAETDTARLWSYRVLSPGHLEKLPYPSPNGGKFIFGAGGYQHFDSLKVQEDGDVCVATLENGGVTTIASDGSHHKHIAMPDSHVTNLCFGGADLCTVFLTMSRSGRLAKMKWASPGLSLHFNNRALI